jgi:hypothetical protein
MEPNSFHCGHDGPEGVSILVPMVRTTGDCRAGRRGVPRIVDGGSSADSAPTVIGAFFAVRCGDARDLYFRKRRDSVQSLTLAAPNGSRVRRR